MRGKAWTPEEEDIIREHYPENGAKYVACMLPQRTLAAVLKRINVLGLKRDKRWSEKEFETLRRYYPTEGAVGIHKRLPHRSRVTIRTVANRLGIKMPLKTNQWTPAEDSVLKYFYPTEGCKGVQTRLVRYRSRVSIQQRAHKLNVRSTRSNISS